MSPQLVLIKLRLRMNKSHSSDYDLIPDWKAVEAINKAGKDWTRRQIHGSNKTQEGDEETRMRINDLQFLLETKYLKGVNKKKFFEAPLPEDYFWYKRIIPLTSKGDCSNIPIYNCTLVEEANVPELLGDWSWIPSFDWRQCFHTILDNNIRVYTDNDFLVSEIDMVYYRKPKEMDIQGYIHEDGRDSTNVDLEFKDDVCELIINEAAAIIAGDIESVNQLQINRESTEFNN